MFFCGGDVIQQKVQYKLHEPMDVPIHGCHDINSWPHFIGASGDRTNQVCWKIKHFVA